MVIGIISGFIGYFAGIPAGAMSVSMAGVAAYNIKSNKAFMPIKLRQFIQVLGGALIDYGFQVTANYIQGKEDHWTDIDWGSVTTSAALGAAGIPGNVKIGKNIYKNVKEAVKMRKRIKNSQKIHICKEKLPTAHQKKLLKRKQKRENIYSEYKNEIKNNFLIGIIRGLAKNIGSEVYENYKNTLGNKYEKCCQDIIIIIIVEIEVEIKIDSFQQYENNNILEENPNYIPPTRPFYPLR